MRYNFDWYCDKHGWKVLVIDASISNVFSGSLYLDDKTAVELYKYIGENFDVGDVDSEST